MSERRINAIYCRYSSHNQDRGTSIEVQLDACRAHAGEGAVEYIDRAVSGTTMERDQFNRLMADAAADRIGTLYVYKFDRFGRDAEAHRYVKMLEASGVRVVSVTEGEDPLTRGIHLVVAEDFSRRHGGRVSDAKLRRFRDGHFHGGPVPFGYRVLDGRLAVDPAEAAVVRRVYGRFMRDSIGHKQLATWLTGQGIRPRRSERWSAGSVRRMLSNPLYVGQRRYRAYEHTAPNVRPGENRSPETLRDESLRIVEDATFEAVQSLMHTRRKVGAVAHHRTRRFSKLLYCEPCGSTYIRRYPSDRPDYVQWGCGLRIRHGRHLCPNAAHVREHVLTERIQSSVAYAFDRRDRIVTLAMDKAERMTGQESSRLRSIEGQIATLAAEIETLADRIAAPGLQSRSVQHVLSDRISDRSRRRDALRVEADRLRSRSMVDRFRLHQNVLDAFDEARNSLAIVVRESEYNAFVRQWFGPMTVHEGGRIVPMQAESCPDAPNAWSFEPQGHEIVRAALADIFADQAA